MKDLQKYFLRDIHLKELFKGSSIALGFKLFSVLMTYIFFYIVARFFGATSLGVFNTCFTVLVLVSVIAKLGLDTAIVKYVAEFIAKDSKHDVVNLYRMSLFLIFCAASILAFVIYVFSNKLSLLFFENTSQALFFKVIGITVVPYSIIQLNSEYYRGLKNITAHSILQNGTIYFFLLLLIFLIKNSGFQVDYLIYFLLIISVILMFISSAFIIKKDSLLVKNMNIKIQKEPINMKKLLSVSTPMLLSNFLFLIMTWTDTLMLSAFKGEDMVGVYNVALKIASLNTIALIAINSIASPKFSEIYSTEGNRRFKRIVHQTTLLNGIISLPIFIIIILFPETLLRIFGEEFITGHLALIILSFGQLISAFSGSTMVILNMTGKEKAGRNILLLTAIVNIVLNFTLIPPFGIKGAAIATMISTIFWNMISVVFIYRNYGFLTFPLSRKSI